MSATSTGTPRTGVRTELARYTVSAGERVLYGQRININGVERFLPMDGVVLVSPQGLSEDDACSSRGIPPRPARLDAAPRKRPNGVSRPHLLITGGAS
jgi:hypothetical protein